MRHDMRTQGYERCISAERAWITKEANGLLGFKDAPATHQLAAHTVCSLEGALVEEMVIAPVCTLGILLEGVVNVQQREVVTCTPTTQLNIKSHWQGQAACLP